MILNVNGVAMSFQVPHIVRLVLAKTLNSLSVIQQTVGRKKIAFFIVTIT